MLKEKKTRSKKYRQWISTLPCCVSGVHGQTQAAHIRTGFFAMGMKPGDDLIVPLSWMKHAEQHSMKESKFWDQYGGVDKAKELAGKLHQLWVEDEHIRDWTARELLVRFRNG